MGLTGTCFILVAVSRVILRTLHYRDLALSQFDKGLLFQNSPTFPSLENNVTSLILFLDSLFAK